MDSSEYYFSHITLKWVWVLGFLQLRFLCGFSHAMPQSFPTVIVVFSLLEIKKQKEKFMLKFMIWMTVITTVGFIALMLLDYGFK